MSRNETLIDSRAAQLRHAFDRGFAAAPPGAPAPSEAFIAIGAGGDRYALRLTEIAGLHADKKVTPLPSRSNDLLGLASFRGALVPVYDLRVLLGYAAVSTPRWLILMAARTPVALAFDRFDGYLDIAREVERQGRPEQTRPYANEIVHDADGVRTIIDLPAVLESITNRAP